MLYLSADKWQETVAVLKYRNAKDYVKDCSETVTLLLSWTVAVFFYIIVF